jgi:hypothetical protein
MDKAPMADFAREKLEAFVKIANLSTGVSSLHADDWKRFHEFVIHVHRRALPITDADVGTALFGAGVSREVATGLGGQFGHELDLLRLYEEQR